MPNQIFDTLINEKVENFYNAYVNVSRGAFFNGEKLIHPGEYGRYRERICNEFLRFFVPNRISIGDGFVITNDNDISSQCDLVLFDSLLTPNIQTNQMQTFYTIESIVGVIEIKSVLKLGDLKKALTKLSEVKALRKKICSPNVKFRAPELNGKVFDSSMIPKDNILSILICERFDFDKSMMHKTMNEIYPNETLSYNKHNLILSLEDGLIMYNLSGCTELESNISTPLDKVLFSDPIFNNHPLSCSYIYADEKRSHITTFLNYFTSGIQGITIMAPEIMLYATGFNKVEFR